MLIDFTTVCALLEKDGEAQVDIRTGCEGEAEKEHTTMCGQSTTTCPCRLHRLQMTPSFLLIGFPSAAISMKYLGADCFVGAVGCGDGRQLVVKGI